LLEAFQLNVSEKHAVSICRAEVMSQEMVQPASLIHLTGKLQPTQKNVIRIVNAMKTLNSYREVIFIRFFVIKVYSELSFRSSSCKSNCIYSLEEGQILPENGTTGQIASSVFRKPVFSDNTVISTVQTVSLLVF
jgi:hypothetical protein